MSGKDSAGGTPRVPRTTLALVAALVVVGIAVVGIQMCRATTRDSDPAATTPRSPVTADATSASVPPSETATQSEEPMPEETVAAFYAAAAAGDLDALKATLGPQVAFDVGLLEGWGMPDHTITLVTAGPNTGEVWVEVEESEGGLPGDVTTFTLVESDGAWQIAEWSRGRVTEQKEFGRDAVVNPQLTRSEQAAVEAVSAFIEARGMGAVSRMREFATARMEREQAALFKILQPGNLTAALVTESREQGDEVIVVVAETWKSGEQMHEYVVVKQGRKSLVDERR